MIAFECMLLYSFHIMISEGLFVVAQACAHGRADANMFGMNLGKARRR